MLLKTTMQTRKYDVMYYNTTLSFDNYNYISCIAIFVIARVMNRVNASSFLLIASYLIQHGTIRNSLLPTK